MKRTCKIRGCARPLHGKGLCHTHYQIEYRKNPTKREAAREAVRRWYRENTEAKREASRRWKRENPEDPEANRKRTLMWQRENPDAARARSHRRNAKKRENGGSWTGAEFIALVIKYDRRCLACLRHGVKLTADHVISIKLGGPNVIANLQPLCGPCNSSKNAKTIDYRPGFRRRLRRLLQSTKPGQMAALGLHPRVRTAA
jgi:5-methylcytosine-specific restriction endonuclease McrA